MWLKSTLCMSLNYIPLNKNNLYNEKLQTLYIRGRLLTVSVSDIVLSFTCKKRCYKILYLWSSMISYPIGSIPESRFHFSVVMRISCSYMAKESLSKGWWDSYYRRFLLGFLLFKCPSESPVSFLIAHVKAVMSALSVVCNFVGLTSLYVGNFAIMLPTLLNEVFHNVCYRVPLIVLSRPSFSLDFVLFFNSLWLRAKLK